MAGVEKCIISLLAEIRAVRERDAAVERWLCNKVGPVCDATQAAPAAGGHCAEQP